MRGEETSILTGTLTYPNPIVSVDGRPRFVQTNIIIPVTSHRFPLPPLPFCFLSCSRSSPQVEGLQPKETVFSPPPLVMMHGFGRVLIFSLLEGERSIDLLYFFSFFWYSRTQFRFPLRGSNEKLLLANPRCADVILQYFDCCIKCWITMPCGTGHRNS